MSKGVVELVFIPSPGMSHLVSTVEAAKLLLSRSSNRLLITILVMKLPKDRNPGGEQKKKMASIMKETSSPERLRFMDLQPQSQSPSEPQPQPQPQPHDANNTNVSSRSALFDYIESHTDIIKQLLSNIIQHPWLPHSRLAGLVLDMFCTKFMEAGEEFNIPSYVCFTSGACSLGLFYDLISLKFEHNQDLRQYKDSDNELPIRCFSQPLPAKVLPPVFVYDGPVGNIFLDYFRRIADTKGILINTFYELEPYAIDSLRTAYNSPKVYPIGPILEANPPDSSNDVIMNWLDDQPENSVVFLCFGTMGAFHEIQVKEFAKALEDCGSRFVWSLRKPGGGPKGMAPLPSEYDNFEEVLPAGFLERTVGIGRVIGWAPQMAVLSHAAVGGFVSHCGWNSTLESVWHGVPVAALPLYAEQQMNAFQLVRELGIAEEIRIDYKQEFMGEASPEIVPAEKIEKAIRRVMMAAGEGGGVRGKVKEMQRKSREALEESGSSYKSQVEFIQDVITNAIGLEN